MTPRQLFDTKVIEFRTQNRPTARITMPYKNLANAAAEQSSKEGKSVRRMQQVSNTKKILPRHSKGKSSIYHRFLRESKRKRVSKISSMSKHQKKKPGFSDSSIQSDKDGQLCKKTCVVVLTTIKDK